MNPLFFITCFAIGGAVYHIGKSSITGHPFDWEVYMTSIYWTGCAAFMVWMGWLKQ